MRRYIVMLSLSMLCAGTGAFAQAASSCADLHLIPAPRECTAVQTVPIGDIGFLVTADKDAEDQFAVEDLIENGLGKRTVRQDAPYIRLERADTAPAQALLAQHHLAFDPAMRDEGYILLPDGAGGLAVIAESAAGIFYGAQTVKQLIRGSGQNTVLLVPTLRDWPAMAHRGLSDDWSRGPLPSMEFLKREIRTLAAYKINIFSPYFEHTFAYDSSPVAAFPGGAMTPDEARELVAYAAQYHITVIPEQESFGHLHHLLKFEQFSALGETPHGSVLAPMVRNEKPAPLAAAPEAQTGQPAPPQTAPAKTDPLPLISGWFSELARVFPGPYAHIGADETFELGMGKTREQVAQQGLGAVYIDFLKQIHTALEPNQKRLLFWGDIAVHSPELVGTLPKDMIAVPWEYDVKPDYKPIIEPFTRAGLETWVAPGVSNWSRLYPNNNEALANIRVFVRDGQALGATGVLNTVWNDDGEGIFDENWLGVLFGAAAGWQPGESSEEAFLSSFGLAFHRDPTGKIGQAERELMAAHAVFKEAGLHGAEDAYFWVDPFSPEGQRVGNKLRPFTSQLRLHAEHAITLAAEALAAAKQENRALENPEALDALELGARRIDFTGLKFQAADEAAAMYAEAQASAADKSRSNDVTGMLWNIGGNNGRLEDIRDGYTLLGGLYRQAWLRDNRPYWLENNLARYDRAAQLWIGRIDQCSLALEQWWNTHTLPSPAAAGLQEPAAAAAKPAPAPAPVKAPAKRKKHFLR